jgi:hypothetical protein
VEERLTRLEEALEHLREENRQLREELELLRALVERDTVSAAALVTPEAGRRSRLLWLVLSLVGIVLPVVALTIWHWNAFWSTLLGAAQALLVYFLGPSAMRLMAEGLVRAIPGVLLGQTTRIALDNMRKRRERM